MQIFYSPVCRRRRGLRTGFILPVIPGFFSHSSRFYISLFALIFQMPALFGQIPVSASISDTNPAPGENFEVVLSVDGAADFYSAAVEVSFDHELIEFVSGDCTGLSEGGLVLSGELASGRAGVSVSRTSPLPADGEGDFMLLTFMVKPGAISGPSALNFNGLTIYNSSGDQEESTGISEVSFDIDGCIGDIGIVNPAVNEINEGEQFIVNVALYASGITDAERIICQIGISASNTDPFAWDESEWQDMIYDDTDENDNLLYSAEISSSTPSGVWYLAARSSLDGGDFVFGGVDGVWHSSDNPSAVLTILPRPPYRYTLAAWDFNNESLITSLSVADNRDVPVHLAGAEFTGFTTGSTGLSANSKGWNDSGTGEPDYWLTEISTSGFELLELSSRQYGSGTGPRDFAVQYSLDGSAWEPVSGGIVEVASDWSSGYIDKLSLPALLNDKGCIFLRWVATSDISVSGGVTGATGTSRIDDISITGINKHPEMAVVYPGDSNNDGIVNADDVLPLGTWWLVNGPPAFQMVSGFEPRNTEQWIPSEATYSDTNGDGVIDHKDLMAVGLNFGKSVTTVTKDSTLPLSVLSIDPLEGGRLKRIMLVNDSDNALRGVSFSLEAIGIPEDMYEIINVHPVFTDSAGPDIIEFGYPDGNVFEGAFAMKGRGEELYGAELAEFELLINEAWDDVFSLNLKRLTISNNNSAGSRLYTGQLIFAGSLSATENIEEAKRNKLLQNYPNPFTGITTIPFHINSASLVRMEITDGGGRKIASTVIGFKEAGTHEVLFDGEHLTSGIYFCRMFTSEGSTRVIKMFRIE